MPSFILFGVFGFYGKQLVYLRPAHAEGVHKIQFDHFGLFKQGFSEPLFIGVEGGFAGRSPALPLAGHLALYLGEHALHKGNGPVGMQGVLHMHGVSLYKELLALGVLQQGIA